MTGDPKKFYLRFSELLIKTTALWDVMPCGFKLGEISNELAIPSPSRQCYPFNFIPTILRMEATKAGKNLSTNLTSYAGRL